MPDTQVEKVKSKVDIVTFINDKVPLKKAGRNFKGLCPFHGEKTPSFFVSPEMQYYKCFGCGVSGDALTFLMQFEGLTFPEALEQLAERVGVTLETSTVTGAEKGRRNVLELMHVASEYYHFLLTKHPIGAKALAYLKQRGISNQSISDFRLGYALDSWDGIQAYLMGKKRYTMDDLIAAGLVIRSEKGSYYDRFRGRLMFPQLSYAGKVVGFSARSMEKDVKEAKYINSAETEYYHKSEILYGLHLAKKAIREKHRIILMEGEFDVISSHQIGLREAVAIKGSAVTHEQAGLIRRLTHNLVLALDADAAGQEAIRRGIVVCENQALQLRVAVLNAGKDPDEIAQKNPSLLKQAISQAESIYGYLIQLAVSTHDTATGEGKKSAAAAVMPELAKIENAVEKEYYINLLAQKLHISQNALFQELHKARTQWLSHQAPVKPETAHPYSRRELLERQLLGLVMQSASPKTELTDIRETWFEQPHLQRLFQALAAAAKSVHQKGVDIVRRLPAEIQPLAHEVYTLRVEWLELSETRIAHLLQETKQQLEQLWTKGRMVAITKELTNLSGGDSVSEALQKEYQALAAVHKRAEAGLDGEASV